MPAPSTTTSTMTTITNDAVLADAGLYRVLAWLSPGFPIGAFSYSHGLEAAAEAGQVHDRASLQGWIAAVVGLGGGRSMPTSCVMRITQPRRTTSSCCPPPTAAGWPIALQPS